MRNLFFYPDLEPNKQFILPAEEARHVKSLRLKTHDIIDIVDGKGGTATAKVLTPSTKRFEVQIIDFSQKTSEKNYYIHIAVAPTKSPERIEWFVEKAVEIGIDEITFLQTKNSVRKVMKSERIFKKAVEAMKQSLRSQLPKINPFIGFEEFVVQNSQTQKFIAYVKTPNTQHLQAKANEQQSYCVLIGSEGGFEPEEINFASKYNFEAVSLGSSRLRTETAALTACMMLNFINTTN